MPTSRATPVRRDTMNTTNTQATQGKRLMWHNAKKGGLSSRRWVRATREMKGNLHLPRPSMTATTHSLADVSRDEAAVLGRSGTAEGGRVEGGGGISKDVVEKAKGLGCEGG